MVICTILYVLMCMAITLARPYYLISASAPFSVLFKTIPGWHWASYLVSVGAVIGVGTVVLVSPLICQHCPFVLFVLQLYSSEGPALDAYILARDSDKIWQVYGKRETFRKAGLLVSSQACHAFYTFRFSWH